MIPNVCPNPRNGGENTVERFYDEEMYNHRWKIERTNAWLDGFKAILTRFDTTISSWKGWNFLAFIVIFLKKFTNQISLNNFNGKKIQLYIENCPELTKYR